MLYKYMPYWMIKSLFGDRKKYGLEIDENDHDYRKWDEFSLQFYNDTQKGFIGKIVNNLGYKILKKISFSNKIVLEVGPGLIEHLKYFNGNPSKYIIADIRSDFLNKSEKILHEYKISSIQKILVSDIKMPLKNDEIDIIISFNQLEHIYELESYIKELKRVLKKGGLFIGSVPCDGGIAWGFGRYFTTRRYINKNTNINYSKIICWEHPNFVDKIKKTLDDEFLQIKSDKKPFRFFPFDYNLSWSFIYKKI